MCYPYYYWCKYLNAQVYCNGCCAGCIRNTDNYQLQQFNYECPNCHGRFNQPVIPSVTSSLYYKCPFCAKIMEGM